MDIADFVTIHTYFIIIKLPKWVFHYYKGELRGRPSFDARKKISHFLLIEQGFKEMFYVSLFLSVFICERK